MHNLSLHYMGGSCGCSKCDKDIYDKKDSRGCGCLKCKQLDSWFRPNCPFGRCGY